MSEYVEHQDLPWTEVLRGWWLGYQRPGGFYVPMIGLRREKPIEFCVKLPGDPDQLGLENPYPRLNTSWVEANRTWRREIPTINDVPDVSKAIDLSRKYQPVTGPMAPA